MKIKLSKSGKKCIAMTIGRVAFRSILFFDVKTLKEEKKKQSCRIVFFNELNFVEKENFDLRHWSRSCSKEKVPEFC